VGGFVGSREDFLASFDNAVDWVYDAYRVIFGRAPDAAGLGGWVKVLGS
jgi:hypothetical protein